MGANWLETLESVGRVDVDGGAPATFNSIMSGEGLNIRARREARLVDPQYQRNLLEAGRLIEKTLDGNRYAALLFQEAMSTSDFPILFTDILDRQVLAKFREWPGQWQALAKRRTVRDFRLAKLMLYNTGATGPLDPVKELTEYPEAAVNEQTPQTYTVTKYGRRFGISWEALVNDDLDMLRDLPDRLAIAARRTEDRTAIALYVDGSGPHASLYTAGNKNIINVANGALVNNPELTIQGLQDAFTVLSKMVDEDGNAIFMDTVTLVVPPALEVQAQNILHATELRLTRMGGDMATGTAGEAQLITTNWMARKLSLVVEPLIPYTATTANGNTSWFLFGNPNSGREALSLVFLRGHEEPESFIKEPNARRIGGGGVDPMEGDFEQDAIFYKIRHVLGSFRTTGGYRSTVASNGSKL